MTLPIATRDNGAETHFADRLVAAVEARQSPVVVGIDPHLDRFPAPLRHLASSTDREVAAAAIQRFVDELLEAIADTVAIVKPQVAFFERLGPAGWKALEHTVARAHEHGLLVLADAKRGDIGSTASAYADYFFTPAERGGLGADAMTVSPYLGPDSLGPFVRHLAQGKGLFVLAKTSNPGSVEIQDLQIEGASGSEPVWKRVGRLMDDLGSDFVGTSGYSSIGLVVGANGPAQAAELRATFPRLPFLVPGYGAQGAGAADVVPAFDSKGSGAIVNASRSILFAYAHGDLPEERWAEASRRECLAMRDAIRDALAAASQR